MDAGRGRKGKKPWQLSLGVKDLIFTGIGVAGLMVICFFVGALAGRGDIYRAAHSWGLLAPEPPKAQWASPTIGTQPAAVPSPSPGSAVSPMTPAPAPVAAQTAKAKTTPETPVAGSIATAPTSPPAAKKPKGAMHQQKAKEEEMRKLRQEVARKLKFQNSFDTTAKTAKAAKTKEKSAAKPTPIKVAQFRDGKAAKAKLAEMQKKGEKVSLKQTKDEKGSLYTIYKQAPPKPGEGEKLAKKSTKSGEKKSKSQSQKN
ncbi:MAG: hypothetical protein FJ134_03245 [Deltaproteobacteria bacterium]|nr:hypothetical protein [Deltaproteobacteria bacterium]